MERIGSISAFALKSFLTTVIDWVKRALAYFIVV